MERKPEKIFMLIMASVIMFFLFCGTIRVEGSETAGSYSYQRIMYYGCTGVDVVKLQACLRKLGFLSGKIDGIFGPVTEKSVRTFQKSKGIQIDGIVGKVTLACLNNDMSISRSGDRDCAPELLEWKEVIGIFKTGEEALVTDVDTGMHFYVRRFGGELHADVEPITEEDARIMKAVYDGAWSWERRAIIVKINDSIIAASMNGMPHGTQTIKDNCFNGHFCIHFLGSRVHLTGLIDNDHQSMILKAAMADN